MSSGKMSDLMVILIKGSTYPNPSTDSDPLIKNLDNCNKIALKRNYAFSKVECW